MPKKVAVPVQNPKQEDEQSATNEVGAGRNVNTAGHACPEIPASQPSIPNFSAEQFITAFKSAFAKTQAEMNQTLVETLRSTPAADFVNLTPNIPTPATGNFSNCTVRFNGRARDAEVLEAFLDAVETYKECTGVSDEHAVRGLAMLLEGDAAMWWRGVKAAVTTWDEATTRLRSVYGAPRPAHKLLREMFAEEQQDERGEVFVW